SRPRTPARAGGVRRVVNPDLVVAEVDHQFDRTARQNPLPGMRWRVRTKPEAVDILVKRRTRDISTQEHGHGPQELGNAAERPGSPAGAAAGTACHAKPAGAAPAGAALGSACRYLIGRSPGVTNPAALPADGTAFIEIMAQPSRLGVRVRQSDIAVRPDEVKCRAHEAG